MRNNCAYILTLGSFLPCRSYVSNALISASPGCACVRRVLRFISYLDWVLEVLAALAYSQNPGKMWFLNPEQWVTHHMFEDAKIWDIPLVKPRFGCSANLALSRQGYDVASELEKILGTSGHHCENGFLDLERSTLRAKPQEEFGAAVGDISPPDITGMEVSVMYTLVHDDANMFQKTFPIMLKRFPGAKEVVIVVSSKYDRGIFRGIVNRFKERTGLEIRVVLPFDLPPTDVRHLFPLLWADNFCTGKFVLHLQANSVLLQPITYARVFHFGKPVLPFTRFAESGKEREVICSGALLFEYLSNPQCFRLEVYVSHVIISN